MRRRAKGVGAFYVACWSGDVEERRESGDGEAVVMEGARGMCNGREGGREDQEGEEEGWCWTGEGSNQERETMDGVVENADGDKGGNGAMR